MAYVKDFTGDSPEEVLPDGVKKIKDMGASFGVVQDACDRLCAYPESFMATIPRPDRGGLRADVVINVGGQEIRFDSYGLEHFMDMLSNYLEIGRSAGAHLPWAIRPYDEETENLVEQLLENMVVIPIQRVPPKPSAEA